MSKSEFYRNTLREQFQTFQDIIAKLDHDTWGNDYL